MHPPALSGLVRRILLPVFILSLLAGVGGFYLLLYRQAIQQAEQEARIMLASALAVGDYTESHILPKLSGASSHGFDLETVPFYASKTVFRAVTGKAALYTFRNPALNPTNPDDLPTPFEVELIRRFRDDRKLTELAGVHDNGSGKIFYVAHPIRIDKQECLACHSSTDRAPSGMVARFGTVNGFGWAMNETVGIQVLTVPVTEQLRDTVQLVFILAVGLLVVFAVAYVALSIAMNRWLIQPLSALVTIADSASRSASEVPRSPGPAVRELRSLGEAIARLHLSLRKALEALARTEPRDRDTA
jgi:HAMP domain-containing protein